ncbi:nucleotidyl transferase AbiEii/AbiGii toxin family protein [Candidatus Gottesmanbacteria bacterium]|nr:nucleotidyl transferase AbiEii/AbiGii toxin family protein [Candidatus Gottesmanbacteria bacterium]
MGNKTILTKIQRKFLDLVIAEPYLRKKYYWTGGTELAEMYLCHRESEDIDLFTEHEEVYLPNITKFVGIAGAKIGAKSIKHTRFLGLYSFLFTLPNENKLKVDFNYYPFTRINKERRWNGLEIDSLEDIAVNKIHTMAMKPRARDFVDLFFILRLKKSEFSVNHLIKMAKIKFDWHINRIQIGENFAKVVTVKDLPRMLVPFNPQKMENFFLALALDLKKEIFA